MWFGEVAGAVAAQADGWKMVLFVVIFVCCVGSVRGGEWLLGCSCERGRYELLGLWM